MLDFRSGSGGIGVNQEPYAFVERPWHRDLGRMQESDDVPAQVLRSAGGKGGIQIASHGKKSAHDIVRLQLIGLDQRSEQLVGCGENLVGIVMSHGSGSADSMNTGTRRHAD
jgi:hypothetical protein